MPSILKNDGYVLLLRKYTMNQEQVIHPILVYKTSKTWDCEFYYNKEIQKKK